MNISGLKNSTLYTPFIKSRSNSLCGNIKKIDLNTSQINSTTNNYDRNLYSYTSLKMPTTLAIALESVKSVYKQADNPIQLNSYEKMVNFLCFPYFSNKYRQFSRITEYFETNIRDALVQSNLGAKIDHLIEFIQKLTSCNQEEYYIEPFFDHAQPAKNAIYSLKYLSKEIKKILSFPCPRGLNWETKEQEHNDWEIQKTHLSDEYDKHIKKLQLDYHKKIESHFSKYNNQELVQKSCAEVKKYFKSYAKDLTASLFEFNENSDNWHIKNETQDKNKTVQNLKRLKEYFEKIKRSFETLKTSHDEFLTKYNYLFAPITPILNSSVACILSVVTLVEEVLYDENSISNMRRGSHIIKIFLTLVACCAAFSNQSHSVARCNIQNQRLKYMIDALDNVILEIEKKWSECEQNVCE